VKGDRSAIQGLFAHGRVAGLLAAIVVAVLGVGVANPAFLAWGSLAGVLAAVAPIVILGVGVGLVVIAGEIDISVGSLFGTLAALLAVLASPTHAAWPVWLSVLVVIGAGGVVGLVNGALTVYGRVPSIVVTLGTLSILRGVTEFILGGAWVTDLPPGLRVLGTGAIGNIPLAVWAAAAVVFGGWRLARRTRLGVQMYAVGDSVQAARYARVRTGRVKMAAFAISGALVGVAVVMSVPQLSVVESGLGVGMELAAVTAIVVGGVSISGGRGSLLGVAAAAVLLGLVRPALIFVPRAFAGGDGSAGGMGASNVASWEQAIHGACILLAVLLDRSRRVSDGAPIETAATRPTPPWGLAAMLVAVLLAARWLSPEFVSLGVQADLVPQLAEIALLAVPMTLILLTGGIDLSVGSAMALAAVAAGIMHESGASPGVAAGTAVAVGAACGAINGLFVTRARVHPLVVTLATLALFRGLALGVSGGRPVSGFAEAWTNLGTARVLGVPVMLLPAIVAAVLAGLALARTASGRALRATGVNETAARHCGLGVGRLKFMAYTLAGSAAGLAACLFIARRNTAKADIGQGIELEVITACVLGGVSLSGGRGGIVGVVLGVLLLHEIRQFAAWRGYPDEAILIVLGGVLILSVLAGRISPLSRPRSRLLKPGTP
jgi:rhamnose transport system permease protein